MLMSWQFVEKERKNHSSAKIISTIVCSNESFAMWLELTMREQD